MNKKKIKKFIFITGVVLGVVFVGLEILAKVKKKQNEKDEELKRDVYENAGLPVNTEKKTFYELHLKRRFDIILSFVGLVLLSPLYLVISAAIVIDDPGPVLFTQKRVGENKTYFKLHKFRSMKMSTPHDTPTHLLENPEQYITRVGKFLRKYSLDELPQIWDIFVGNMSIIGPRPALWNQDDLVAERDKYGANDVKPGLTGWAQINGRDELEIPVKAKFDGEYCATLRKGNISGCMMDVKCFLSTIYCVIKHLGVVEGGIGEIDREVTENKKIVVLSSHTPSLFWFRMDMMKSFIEQGYEVFAVGNESEDEWTNIFAERGIIYRKIDVERNGVNPIGDIKTLFSIKKILRRINPEKVFTYQAKTVIYGGIAANQLGIGEVYPLIAGMGSVFLKNDLKTKIIRKIMITAYRLGMHKSPAVFFQNHDDEQVFRSNHIIDTQKVVMIPGSGVNLEQFKMLPMPEIFGFLCISRLIRDKGVYEYLEACRRVKTKYPNVRCLLVGPYDSNPSAMKPEELQSFIEDGIIEYFGEQEDVRPYLAQCNVFVLPSYREGTPKTNLEAMASGRAVITTDAPGCRETVVDGENGFLVPVKDIKSLCKKMIYCIDNPELISVMGAKGREKVETNFDVDIVNRIICETMGLIALK